MTGTEVVPADDGVTVGAVERKGTRVEYQPPASLFRTDEPALIVARATEVAEVLSKVLRDRNLTMRIGPKDHVLVEGWTLCGSMLGVFPVVEWTRKLEDGWEARVEARTRDGAVVGSAEAMCVRAEKRWKSADEYAIRSMAQTRATSKAMRGPLGFVVQLAGFEATPAEEMPDVGNGGREFDPSRDVLPGAVQGSEGYFERLAEATSMLDGGVNWWGLFNDYGKQAYDDSNRTGEFWRRVSNAVAKLYETFPAGSFPPPLDTDIQAAFAWAFDGELHDVTYKAAVEHEELDEEAATAAGDDEPAPLPADTPLPDDDDDVPFGDAAG